MSLWVIVLLADRIKVAKEGRKMPAVKFLHQDSQSNSKAEYIMGHSIQAISLLAGTASHAMAVHLVARIHEGIVRSNRHAKTRLDKLYDMLQSLLISVPYYLVADAYYASGSFAVSCLKNSNHFITRVRNNAVGYKPAEPKKNKSRGRPKIYGGEVPLASLFDNLASFSAATSPAYSDEQQQIKYLVRVLYWRTAGRIMRFVLVEHLGRGKISSCLKNYSLTLSRLSSSTHFASKSKSHSKPHSTQW